MRSRARGSGSKRFERTQSFYSLAGRRPRERETIPFAEVIRGRGRRCGAHFARRWLPCRASLTRDDRAGDAAQRDARLSTFRRSTGEQVVRHCRRDPAHLPRRTGRCRPGCTSRCGAGTERRDQCRHRRAQGARAQLGDNLGVDRLRAFPRLNCGRSTASQRAHAQLFPRGMDVLPADRRPGQKSDASRMNETALSESRGEELPGGVVQAGAHELGSRRSIPDRQDAVELIAGSQPRCEIVSCPEEEVCFDHALEFWTGLLVYARDRSESLRET